MRDASFHLICKGDTAYDYVFMEPFHADVQNPI